MSEPRDVIASALVFEVWCPGYKPPTAVEARDMADTVLRVLAEEGFSVSQRCDGDAA